MSASYSRQAETALRLLTSRGQAVTLFRIGVAGYDPVNPAQSTPAILNRCAGNGIVLPASTQLMASFDDRILTDPLLRQSFRYVILAGVNLTFKPQAQDILQTGEGYYRLLGANPLNPAGEATAIIWSVGCTLDTQIDLTALITVDSSGDIEWEIVDTTPNASQPVVAIDDSNSIDFIP